MLTQHEKNLRLRELAMLFLRLGTTAFGGPAAHIAMMHDEVVTRRKWLTDQEFLDLNSATNLIPGPNSTELAIHIGYLRAGWRGLLVAGTCFILPAVVIVTAFAWAYVQYGATPQAEALFYGIQPVVIVIIAQALWLLGRKVFKHAGLLALGAAILGLYLLGVNEIFLLVVAGVVVMVWRNARRATPALFFALPLQNIVAAIFLTGAPLVAAAVEFSYTTLFLYFLKIGSVLYGSGYVLLAFLYDDFVQNLGWLTEQQLLDAVAIGQITPGPVFTTATFIGDLVGGGWGAVVATVGIFLPAFVFVGITHPFIPRMRASKWFGALLDGVNVASAALMAGITLQLARTAVTDWYTLGIALVAAVILFRFKLNATWLMLGGAIAGLVFFALRG
jgi:chromate transporter